METDVPVPTFFWSMYRNGVGSWIPPRLTELMNRSIGDHSGKTTPVPEYQRRPIETNVSDIRGRKMEGIHWRDQSPPSISFTILLRDDGCSRCPGCSGIWSEAATTARWIGTLAGGQDKPFILVLYLTTLHNTWCYLHYLKYK